jgi:hypothetical protein
MTRPRSEPERSDCPRDHFAMNTVKLSDRCAAMLVMVVHDCADRIGR